MTAPYDATTVANRFIELARGSDGPGLTPMQLIKLSYIAHGFSLAINRRPLLNESVEAWRYGPVVPSLYRKLKQHGSSEVTSLIPPPVFGGRDDLAAEDKALVDAVFAKYGSLNGIQLSYLTHKKGTPWERAYKADEYGIDLDDEDIRRHYEDLLRNAA